MLNATAQEYIIHPFFVSVTNVPNRLCLGGNTNVSVDFFFNSKKITLLSLRKMCFKVLLVLRKRNCYGLRDGGFAFSFSLATDNLRVNENFCQYELGSQKFHHIIELINQTIVYLHHQASGKGR